MNDPAWKNSDVRSVSNLSLYRAGEQHRIRPERKSFAKMAVGLGLCSHSPCERRPQVMPAATQMALDFASRTAKPNASAYSLPVGSSSWWIDACAADRSRVRCRLGSDVRMN